MHVPVQTGRPSLKQMLSWVASYMYCIRKYMHHQFIIIICIKTISLNTENTYKILGCFLGSEGRNQIVCVGLEQ
jgi:hypothetical protein